MTVTTDVAPRTQPNPLTTRGAALLPSPDEWAVLLQVADQLVKSGLLPPAIKTAAAAVAVIQKGRELSIAPMYALSNIVVISGRPTASAELMAALIYRDHGDSALIVTRSDGEACTISYKRRGWPQRQSHTFTTADAQAAGLLGKDTWKQYRPAMLRARCISAVARMAFPDTIGGLYTPEELGADVDGETGEVLAAWPPDPVPHEASQADRPTPAATPPPGAARLREYYEHLSLIAAGNGYAEWVTPLAADAPDDFVIDQGRELKRRLREADLLPAGGK